LVQGMALHICTKSGSFAPGWPLVPVHTHCLSTRQPNIVKR